MPLSDYSESKLIEGPAINIDKHESIKRAEAAELCRLSLPQAYHLLKRLENQGKIKQTGKMRYAVYRRNT